MSLRALAIVLTAAGCVAPTQYGGPIAVDQAGLSRRLSVVCRLAAGDETVRGSCPPLPPPSPTARPAAPLASAPADLPTTISQPPDPSISRRP